MVSSVPIAGNREKPPFPPLFSHILTPAPEEWRGHRALRDPAGVTDKLDVDHIHLRLPNRMVQVFLGDSQQVDGHVPRQDTIAETLSGDLVATARGLRTTVRRETGGRLKISGENRAGGRLRACAIVA